MRLRFPVCMGLCLAVVVGCGGGSSSKPDGAADAGKDAPVDHASDKAASDIAAGDIPTSEDLAPVDDSASMDGDTDDGTDSGDVTDGGDGDGYDGGPGPCVTAVECPGQDGECAHRTCIDGVCGISNTAAGYVLPTQAPRDCQVRKCDGNGQPVVSADDSDLPVDGLGCTMDVCSNGVPSNPPLANTATCAENGGTHCNGSGACVQCNVPANCGTDTECKKWTCSAQGVCGRNDPVAGTALAIQTSGDCKTAACNGTGDVTSQNDDNDKPNDSNDCTNDICTGGAASHTFVASGTACSAGQCDGAGHCSGCTYDADCGPNTDCATFTCTNHVCSPIYTADGTAVTTQTPGDCKKTVCNGAGGTRMATDDSDTNDDGNACTHDACSNGTASHTNENAGVACNQSGGVMCDGAGVCGASLVRINETQSNNPDWIELANTSASMIDISGWTFKDNDDTHSYVFPATTTIGPQAYLVVDAFTFGLGSDDMARLFDSSGHLLDSSHWTAQPTTSWARCPDKTGDFKDGTPITKGAANTCVGP